MSHACVGPMALWHMSNICRSAQATASRKTLPETPEVSGCRVGSCKNMSDERSTNTASGADVTGL